MTFHNDFICCVQRTNKCFSLEINVCLLGCNVMWTCRWIGMFWRNVRPPTSGQLAQMHVKVFLILTRQGLKLHQYIHSTIPMEPQNQLYVLKHCESQELVLVYQELPPTTMRESSYVPNTLMLAQLHSQHIHQKTERKAKYL
jgi:hypothetical protein